MLLILDMEELAKAMNWIGLALTPTHELYHFIVLDDATYSIDAIQFTILSMMLKRDNQT